MTIKKLAPIATIFVILSCAFSLAAGEVPADPSEKDARQFVRQLMTDLNGRAPTDQELADFISEPQSVKNRLDGYRKTIEKTRALNQTEKQQHQVKQEQRDLDDATRLLEIRLAYDNLLQQGKGTVAYLGVGVEAPGDALRSQLRLPQGLGLVVNFVDADGPSKELVHLHDVLEKVDDQLLLNGEQFAALVRMHKKGEQITLGIIREARPMQVTVKLGENSTPAPQEQSSLPTNEARLDFTGWAVNKNSLLSLSRTGPVTIDDGTYAAVIQQGGDSGRVAVLDKSTGKLIFSGPLQNEQQWSYLPENLRSRLSAWKALVPAVDPSQSLYEQSKFFWEANAPLTILTRQEAGLSPPATEPTEKK